MTPHAHIDETYLATQTKVQLPPMVRRLQKYLAVLFAFLPHLGMDTPHFGRISSKWCYNILGELARQML